MSGFRAPQLQVLAGGVALPGALAVEVAAGAHFGAATWRASFATNAAASLSAWEAYASCQIEIDVGLGMAGFTPLVIGAVDTLTLDGVANTILFEGRDLTAGLIEARIEESFANQTASDVATLLAGRHNLMPQVTATTTPIGRYYGNDHTRVTLGRHVRASTEWDLLAWLAQQEDFDVFVTGASLVFQPTDPALSPALTLQAVATAAGPANVTSLQLRHALTLAGATTVTVKSWNTQQMAAISETATRDGDGNARQFVTMHPNMDAGSAQLLATRKLAAILAHEYTAAATMPGELTLAPRCIVAVTGTDSSFDRTYRVEDIVRRFDMRQGFSQSVRASTAGD